MPRCFALLVLVTALAGCADPAPAGDAPSSAGPVGRAGPRRDRVRGGRIDARSAHRWSRPSRDGSTCRS